MRQCLLCLSLLEEQLNFIDLLQLKRKEKLELIKKPLTM